MKNNNITAIDLTSSSLKKMSSIQKTIKAIASLMLVSWLPFAVAKNTHSATSAKVSELHHIAKIKEKKSQLKSQNKSPNKSQVKNSQIKNTTATAAATAATENSIIDNFESAGLALNILAAELMTKDQPAEVWQNYMLLAKEHQSPWFAKRAYEVAKQSKAVKQTQESLILWQELEMKAPAIDTSPPKNKNLYSKSDDVQKYLSRKIDLNKQLAMQALSAKEENQSLNYLRNYLSFNQELLDYNLKLIDFKYQKNTDLSATEIENLKKNEKNKEQEKITLQILDIEAWLNQQVQNDAAFLKIITPKVIAEINTWPENWQLSGLKISLLQKIDLNQARIEAQKARQTYADITEIELAEILLKDPPQRIDALANFIKNKPENRVAQLFYLRNLFAVGRLEEAKTHINEIVQKEMYRQDFEIYFLLAQIYRVQKNLDQAVQLIEELSNNVRNLPDVLYLFVHDVLRERNQGQDKEKAFEWLEKANLDVNQRMQLVGDYLKNKSFSDAMRQLDIIEKDLNVYDKALFYNHTTDLWVFYQQNQYAIMQLEKLLQLSPKNYQAHLVLANLYLKENKIESATAVLEKAITIDSNNPLAYNFLAYTYAEHSTDPKILDKAIEYVQKALQVEPNVAAYQDTLGWLYFKKKDLVNAKIWLEKAWNTEKEIEIGTHLLEVYHESGLKAEAANLKSFLLDFVQKVKADYQKDITVLENMLKIQAEQNQRENEIQAQKAAQTNTANDSAAQQAIEKMKNLRGQIAFKTSEQIQELQKKQKETEALEAKLQNLITRLKI